MIWHQRHVFLAVSICVCIGGSGLGWAQPHELPDLADVTLVPVGGTGALSDPPPMPLYSISRIEPGDRTLGDLTGHPVSGRVTIRQLPSRIQETTILEPGGTRPVRWSVRLPFVLHQWMGDGLDGGVEYNAVLSPFFVARSIRLAASSGPELTLLNRRTNRPIVIENGGATIEQGPGVRSGAIPAHTYWYPVPTVVRFGGTATLLWQRQAVVVPTGSGSGRIAVVVLASEVAKPIGRSAHLFEGPRYNLDLLLLRIDG